MVEAGGRLFVDVTRLLASPASRAGLLEAMGRHDPLIGDALQTVLDAATSSRRSRTTVPPAPSPPAPRPDRDRSGHRHRADRRTQASIAAAKRDIRTKSGPELLDFILADIQELQRILFDPRSHQVFMDAMESRVVAQRAAAGVAGREERGRHAHAVRPPQRHVGDGAGAPGRRGRDPPASGGGGLPAGRRGRRLPGRAGRAAGRPQARAAIQAFLDAYGMRCIGEIDITRPRWSERPSTLVPVILGNVRNFEPGAGERRFEQGRRAARAKEQDVLERLQALPDGAARPRRRRARSTASGPSSATGSIRSTSSSAAPSPTSRRCWRRPGASWRPACSEIRRTSFT
jgi:pyruvate,water dikinase